MPRRAPSRLLAFGLAAVLAAGSSSGSDLHDLYFGEALFHADQGHYFDALQRLDTELGQYHGLDEPQYDSLHYHIGAAEFDVGDFELNYRMHHRAGRAIRAVLEGNVDAAVRNEAAFRLARIHFQKDQPEDALHALQRIDGEVPEAIADEIEFLRANVYMALGRPADAVEVLADLQRADSLTGFAAYNLGIALLQDGRTQEAIEQLDRAGRVASGERGAEAIRDKANLILGTMLFEAADYQRAYQSLDRVRLEGPFSNQALLRAGWAEVSAGNFERALVPWNILAKREVTDTAVQEALLAAPFVYGKLEIHGRAALMYGHALEAYTNELDRVDASIDSIRKGKFLKALLREELKQDRDWVIRLRTLPETPETYYLMALMASHDFQTALSNYLDLEDLRTRLVSWETSFGAFEDIIGLRKQNYDPLLPEVDADFRELDSQIRLRMEQREHLDKRLQGMLTAPRPDYLATADERIVSERLDQLERQLIDPAGPQEAGAAAAHRPCARRTDMAAPDAVPRAADRGAHASERAECRHSGDDRALPEPRPDPASRHSQLCRLRRSDQPAAATRRRGAAESEPAHGAPGAPARARSPSTSSRPAASDWMPTRLRPALPSRTVTTGRRDCRRTCDRMVLRQAVRSRAMHSQRACSLVEGSNDACTPSDMRPRFGAVGRLRRPARARHARDASRCRARRRGSEGRAGPRNGHAELPAVPRGNAADRDDAGGNAATRGSTDREAVRYPRGR